MKYDTSPLTRRVQEICTRQWGCKNSWLSKRYLVLYEIRRPKWNMIPHRLREGYKKYVHISEDVETVDYLNVNFIPHLEQNKEWIPLEVLFWQNSQIAYQVRYAPQTLPNCFFNQLKAISYKNSLSRNSFRAPKKKCLCFSSLVSRTVALRQQVQNSRHAEIPIQNSQSHNKWTPVRNKSYFTYRFQHPLRKRHHPWKNQ
jgi:hypothetical protein